MKEDVLVSVVIPTYKRADGLLRCVNSVLSQTYSNIEIVVVDDNDPDTEWRRKTAELMNAFVNEEKVKYIQHKKNINGSAARNTGIKKSSGAYVCFLDDDDFYYKDKIKKQIEFLMSHSQYDACFCDCTIGGKKNIVELKENYTRQIFLCEKTPQTSGWMISRESLNKLNGFDEGYLRHQDYEFLLRFYKNGFHMGKVNEVLYERTQTCVDNTPKGKNRERMKKKLFSDFEPELTSLLETDSTFRNAFYLRNYIPVLTSYLRCGCVIDALRIFFFLMIKNPCQTCILLCKRICDFIKR